MKDRNNHKLSDLGKLLLWTNLGVLTIVIAFSAFVFFGLPHSWSTEDESWQKDWHERAEKAESNTRLRELVNGCLNYSLSQRNQMRNLSEEYVGVIYFLCTLIALLSMLNLVIAFQLRRVRDAA